jgi:hypothetical protein
MIFLLKRSDPCFQLLKTLSLLLPGLVLRHGVLSRLYLSSIIRVPHSHLRKRAVSPTGLGAIHASVGPGCALRFEVGRVDDGPGRKGEKGARSRSIGRLLKGKPPSQRIFWAYHLLRCNDVGTASLCLWLVIVVGQTDELYHSVNSIGRLRFAAPAPPIFISSSSKAYTVSPRSVNSAPN